MTPAASASSPQGTAWRVLTIPTLPKYTAFGKNKLSQELQFLIMIYHFNLR